MQVIECSQTWMTNRSITNFNQSVASENCAKQISQDEDEDASDAEMGDVSNEGQERRHLEITHECETLYMISHRLCCVAGKPSDVAYKEMSNIIMQTCVFGARSLNINDFMGYLSQR